MPDGPIERFFEKQIQNQFLHSGFNGEYEQRLFLSGLLSDASSQVLMNKIQILAKEFTELHRHDTRLPLNQRRNMGLMLVMRPWELEVFRPLRR